MSMNFIQSQRQLQKVNPQLIQRAEILQMSAQELLSYIYDETVENPLIDMDALNLNDMRERLDWLSRSSAPSYSAPAADDEDFPAESAAEPAAENTLREQLAIELSALKLDRREERICRYLLEAVDSRGYLDEEPGDTAKILGVSETDAARCLDIMRSLSPTGVCAKDLRQCLLTQLRALGGDSIAEKIVESHLERLAKGHYAFIAKALGCSAEDVKRAAGKIKSLSPIPAAEFSDGAAAEYSLPDARVLEDGEESGVELISPYSPSLRLSSFYDNLYKTSDDRELKDYLDKKLRSAKALIDGVSMRERTMLSCLEAVFKLQKDYLLCRRSSPQPMTLQDIADITGLSTATVSRALKGKNLQCRRGVIPLKNLFSVKISSGDSTQRSSCEAMELIRRLTDSEDKQSPLSDTTLAEALAAEGIEISRRTVAKYREKMEIPGTFARKKAAEEKQNI